MKDIFLLSNEKVTRGMLVFLISMSLLVFPIGFDLVNSKSMNYGLFGADLALTEYDGLLEDLPQASIVEGRLVSTLEEVLIINLKDQFIIIVNPTEDKVTDSRLQETNGVVFNETNYELYLAGNSFQFNYNTFSNVHFSDLKNMSSTEGIRVIYDNLYVSAKRVFLLPVILILLLVFVFINLIYLAVISFFATFLRYKDQNIPPYTGVLKIALFASLVPSVIAMIIGMFAPPMTIVIYNFGLPAVMFISYLKYKNVNLTDTVKKLQ
jgi:maltodextrin utilization protein YvdJ